MSYNPSIVSNNAFFSKISNPIEIAITAAISATIDRMHVISGTSADYNITLPVAPITGTIVSFRVKEYNLANKQYKLDAGVGVILCGRTRYLILVHTNSATLIWNGTAWEALELTLDTPWINSGVIDITAVTSNPTKGTTAKDAAYWRRIGNSEQVRLEYEQTGAGSAGTDDYLFKLPIGDFSSIITAKTGAFGISSVPYIYPTTGTSQVVSSGYYNHALRYDSTKFRIRARRVDGSSVDFIRSATIGLDNTTVSIGIDTIFPILDW